MGHSNDDTVMDYISGIVGVDSQSMVHGRDQRTELIEENNTSMMSKRNLLAPLPPGSQLTDRASIARAIEPNIPVAVVTLSERTPKEEYALRRQSRTVAYRKQRKDFFEGKTSTPYATASVSAQATSKPLRSPSRYLQALWKFEPERKAITNLMYPGCDTETEGSAIKEAVDKVEISLNNILEPMVTLSNPEKKRYTYASASPTKDMHYSVCGKQFIQKNKKSVSLLRC
jgi:hypothetical protein